MNDDQLLDSVFNPADHPNDYMGVTRDGRSMLNGNHQATELMRRAALGTGRINWTRRSTSEVSAASWSVEVMRRLGIPQASRGKTPSAARAVAGLLQSGMLEIRAMAASQDVAPSVEAGARTESSYDNDYVARIRMISDVCHTFGQALMGANQREREHHSLAALSYRWDVAIPEARQWIRSRIAELGEEYLSLVDKDTDSVTGTPNASG